MSAPQSPIMEIPTSGVTVLVARPGQSPLAGYPVYLSSGPAHVLAQLQYIYRAEGCTAADLVVTAIEIADPDDYDAVVTVDASLLSQALWIHGTQHTAGIPAVSGLASLIAGGAGSGSAGNKAATVMLPARAV